MADALISATIQVTLETALSLATDRIGLLFGFKEDLANMTESLGLIRAFLSDAVERQVQDRAVQEWLKNLEGVAFDAENVLDELNYHFLRHEVESRNQLKRKVCFFFSFSNCNIAFRWRMASKVRDINEKLIKINQQTTGLGLGTRLAMIATSPAAATGSATSRQTDSVVAPINGRANDESDIVKMLLSQSEKIISVIPVTGMGGIGKTTLAKSIYNNKEIVGHFPKQIWACVSKKVKVVELFKLILVQLEEKVEVTDRNAIVQKIGKLLEGKRYFLVLDDVWNCEQELWNDFFITLKGLNPANGSWCLITTRLEQLAHTVSRLLMMDVEPYFLGRLTDDDCWSILKDKAIGGEKEPEELKAIRDRVIKRCDGLPLAASVIGGLLCLSAKEKWLLMVEKSLLSGDQSGVEQILKVSFDYLSSASVKKCFAYCSIFPKDTEMERNLLIELWMAEGFLVPGSDNETVMEKIGDKYLRVLLQSSLFQEIRDGEGVCYTMHDLVHDLAESISKSKSINLEAGVMDNNFQVRYLAVNSALEKNHIENISTSLRTLFLESGMSGETLVKFKNLHVLNLTDAETMEELPTTIDKLIHLRYIDLSNSEIQALPESLCKLYNLQTLRLIDCDNLKVLPKGMSNLISLRHLHYYTDDASFKMPLEMGQLTCLQTLEFFNVGQEKGRGIEELECLKGLKGKLEIRNLELVKGKEEAEKANLIGKEDLFRLELFWGSRTGEGDNSRDEEVLKGLRPHSNLQELVIKNFIGDQFPQWFKHLSRLVDLELRDCSRCRELPVALGTSTTLSNLKIDGMAGLRNNNTIFQNLKNLRLGRCPNLTSISGWRGTCLESLEIKDCENLRELPEFRSLHKLHIENCPTIIIIPEGRPNLTSLEQLTIKNCMGNQFPQWFMHLSRLVDLELRDCSRCRELPIALGRLPSLQHLKLSKLESITSIGLSFYGIDNHSNSSSWAAPRTTLIFPALKTLSLEEMENLVEWMGAEEEVRSTTATTTGGGGESFEEVLDVFPVLESLIINNCSKLTTAPSHFSSLKELKIRGNNHVSLLKSILFSKGISTTLSTLQVNGGSDSSAVSDNIVAAGGLFNNNNATIFQNLKDVSFQYYPYLTSISGWICPCLESLDLIYCENLRELPPPEDLFEFQCLRKLQIETCPRVEIIPEALSKLMSLEELSVGGCNELTNLPLEMPKSLRELVVYSCPNLVSFLLEAPRNLTSLEELSIGDCNELTNLPLEMPKSLQRLVVFTCPNLVSFPLDLQQTPSLLRLTLAKCPKLKTEMTPKGFGFLTSLRFLSIGPFSDDDENASSVYNEFDWDGILQSSSTLRYLHLYGLPHMESLPHQLQYLTTLTYLRLRDFGGIEALPDWIGNLQSLHFLYLRNCEKLRCLPSMDAMTRLTKLGFLWVVNCPLLKERCSPSCPTHSSERSKIAHIPNCHFE